MPLWVSDFIGDTMDLDAKDVGAYLLLLMAMWQRGGSIPSDEKTLKRITRTGRDFPKIWARLERFFICDSGFLTNGRLASEVQKVVTKREVNAQLGALGGRAKSLNNKGRGLANATPRTYHTITIPKEDDKSSSSEDRVGDKIKAILAEKRKVKQ
jgi:uncharacterized protein YdaU (DUF1376 family)